MHFFLKVHLNPSPNNDYSTQGVRVYRILIRFLGLSVYNFENLLRRSRKRVKVCFYFAAVRDKSY